MRACIITIGDELLQGFTIDTNSSWIGKQLISHGVQVIQKITVGDVHDEIVNSVASSLRKKFDFIFITGGLGPTHDDVTKKAICSLFKADEYFDSQYYEELKRRFAKRKVKISENNRSQATMISGSDPIPNPLGTALGIHFKKDCTHLFIMPGVPIEMKGMMSETILPEYLPPSRQHGIRTLQTKGIPESKLAAGLNSIMDQYSLRYRFAFLPHHTGVSIRISPISEYDPDELDRLICAIKSEIGIRYYGEEGALMEAVVGKLLLSEGKTLATAESCTGGLISKMLTDVPGSSGYFSGGIVAYSNVLKTRLLGVNPGLLAEYGAVSSEVASAMAEGCRQKTGADIGISTTGISGPDGATETKPVGLVYISIADENSTHTRDFHFINNRTMHREMTAQTALDMVRISLQKKHRD